MSEYQYYEFRTVDRPLTREEMGELRDLSTRAEITPTSFQNEYHYGSFRGDPDRLMKRYFDAHVYVSNFGSCVFMLRFPQTVLKEEDLAPYIADEALSVSKTEKHLIVQWRLEDEPQGMWMEGEGWMDRLLPIREELARGDYRSLYIGWLGWVQASAWEYEEADAEREEDDEGDEDLEVDEAEMEPPVPPGLRKLTESQAALVEFLEIDPDLVSAAARASANLSKPSPAGMDRWVASLPEEEVRAALARVVRGEGASVQLELQSRYHRSSAMGQGKLGDGGRRRTPRELLALSQETERERVQREKAETERKRREHLDSLVPQFTKLWNQVDYFAERQTGSGYDEATRLLVDLRDAYRQANRSEEFQEQFARFWEKHGGRKTLKSRLKDAGLVD